MTKRNSAVAPTAEMSSSKAINKMITQVRATGAKYLEQVHNAAVAIMVHANAFGDCTGAARLIDAMPKSVRRGIVARWFEKFSPIIVEPKAGVMNAHFAKAGSSKDKKFDLDGARANPWHTLVTEDAPGDFFTVEDVQTALERLVKRIDKKIEDGEAQADQVERLKTYQSAIKVLAKSTPANDTKAAPAAEVLVGEPVAKAA